MSRDCLKYGLSDVGLAKICAEWSIPCPPRGYWVKKRNGKTVRARKLPHIEEGNPVILSYRKLTVEEVEAALKITLGDPQIKFEKYPENHITVVEQLTEPHPLVVRTEKSIRNSKADEIGMVRPKARQCLDLAVTPSLIDRSLCILDAIIKALDARKYPVTVIDGDRPRTQARVLEEDIGFQLYEDTVRQEREPTQDEIEWELRWSPDRKFYVRVPSGKLVLRITDGHGLRRCWTDRSDRRVEQFLNSFVIGLIRTAEAVKVERFNIEIRRKEREQQERRRQEEEQRRRAEERQRQEEETHLRRLEAEAAAWVKAEQIRAYVAAVKEAAQRDAGAVVPGGELERWVAWAMNQADTLDPIRQSKPPQ